MLWKRAYFSNNRIETKISQRLTCFHKTKIQGRTHLWVMMTTKRILLGASITRIILRVLKKTCIQCKLQKVEASLNCKISNLTINTSKNSCKINFSTTISAMSWNRQQITLWLKMVIKKVRLILEQIWIRVKTTLLEMRVVERLMVICNKKIPNLPNYWRKKYRN